MQDIIKPVELGMCGEHHEVILVISEVLVLGSGRVSIEHKIEKAHIESF
jgi:hypothetical protein